MYLTYAIAVNKSEPATLAKAYACWAIALVGVCGIQRIYLKQYKMGLIYFLTAGLFGIGQVVDAVLISGMVEKYNRFGGDERYAVKPQIRSEQVYEHTQYMADDMAELIRAATYHNGVLSPAQAAMYLKRSPRKCKALLDQAMLEGYCDVINDPDNGKVRYKFDVLL